MKPSDPQLDELLRSVRVPERSAGYWENFPARVLARLQTAERPPETSRGLPFSWGLGFAAACLILGFALGHWHGMPKSVTESPLAQNRKLFKEVASLFPNQVRAIISDEHGVRLVLADKQEAPSSAPLLLKICDGKNCHDVITFSGQQVQLDGKTYEVLLDAQGNVMVVGKSLYWHSKETRKPGESFHIEAQKLDTSI